MRRRLLALFAAPLVFAFTSACGGGGGGPIGTAAMLAPSDMHAVTATIQPSIVPVTPISGFGCPLVPPFSASFGIVLQSPAGGPFGSPFGGSSPFAGTASFGGIGTAAVPGVFVDHVTFHFLDGSNITSQPLTFGRESPAGLNTLRFTPQFGCGIGAPAFVVADIGFIDGLGTPFTVSTRAPMQ